MNETTNPFWVIAFVGRYETRYRNVQTGVIEIEPCKYQR